MNIPRYNTHDFDPLTETGLLQQNSVSETAPLHTHEFFEMFLVTDGKALHLVNDSVQNIEGGDLVLIRPDDRHCYDFYKSFDFKFTNLAFPLKTMSLITELFLPDKPLAEMLSARLPSVAHLSPDAAAFIDSEFLKIGNLKSELTPEYARCYFKSFLATLMCKYFIGTGTKDVDSPKWLASTVSQMKSIENFQIGFSRMLELSRCSEEHLCREFKKYYKTTPVKFINEQRLSYSLYLLSNTKTEIIEISQLCGFNNLSHFYHLFKEQFDVSPRKFRVSHQLNRAQTPFSNKY